VHILAVPDRRHHPNRAMPIRVALCTIRV